MTKLLLKNLPMSGKKVLMRVDFNVPLDSQGQIADDTRIRLSLPSIDYILKQDAALILISHLGRPNGDTPSLSLEPCGKRLSALLKKEVLFCKDCIGPTVKLMTDKLQPGSILLLENLRFHKEEEHPNKDFAFAKSLASIADVYVNDAFGAAHRAHSSISAITHYFPHKAAMGFLMEKEITFLQETFKHPKRPFYAILGGAKISSKLGVFNSLLSKVDALFIGGGMSYTFAKALGSKIGNSICDNNLLPLAHTFLENAKKNHTPYYLPTDHIIAKTFENTSNSKIVSAKEGIPEGWMGMDIGPQTLKTWSQELQKAATVFWNGPLGVFEFSHFTTGTFGIAKALASLKATTIVGGGDSISAINSLGLQDSFTHISSGGGASLELIEYGHLPGIDALSDV
ncbi:MAG: phosphoglycerate kinase [Chlamydiota bacterium]